MSESWDRPTVYGGLAKLLVVLGVVLAVVLFAFGFGRRLEPGWHDFAAGRVQLLLPEGGEDVTGVDGSVPNPGTRVVVARPGVRVHAWVEDRPRDWSSVLESFDAPRPFAVEGPDEAWLLIGDLEAVPPSSTCLAAVLFESQVGYLALDLDPDDLASRSAARALLASLRAK